MHDKILFVDDDPKILSTFRRLLHGKYTVDTAIGPIAGLRQLNKFGPYAVVVADMKMPEMNGIDFLNRVKDFFPDTVRIMLTGHADIEMAVKAINNGEIFRFLNKPCMQTKLLKALEAAITHHNLLVSEKELLEKTLTGTVQILMDLLSLTSEKVMGRVVRIKRYVRDVAMHLKETDVWMYETAVMLSQIGCITMPESIVKKIDAGIDIEDEEMRIFMQHPVLAAEIVRKIPRMEHIATIITYQHKHFDGGGFPQDSIQGNDLPLGSRILKVALDFDAYVMRGMSYKNALLTMKNQIERYDIQVFKAFLKILQMEETYEINTISLDRIQPGMILLEDIIGLNTTVLLKKGNEITEGLKIKLSRMDSLCGVKQPVKVLIPPCQPTSHNKT